MASLKVAKFLVLAAPDLGPDLAVSLCVKHGWSDSCGTTYSRNGIGHVISQVVAYADVGGNDGQACRF